MALAFSNDRRWGLPFADLSTTHDAQESKHRGSCDSELFHEKLPLVMTRLTIQATPAAL